MAHQIYEIFVVLLTPLSGKYASNIYVVISPFPGIETLHTNIW
jgi:hypothetical protein